MKSLFLLLGLTVVTNSLFAATLLTGEKATKLQNALTTAGAEKAVYVDAQAVVVKNLKCHEEGGIRLEPMKCSFVDNASGRLVEIDAVKASKLAACLKAAGLHEYEIHRGEYFYRSISAKTISCYSTIMPKALSCQFEQE